MFNKKIYSLVLALTLLLSPAHAAEKITIADFGKERFLLRLPLYIAMEEGLFAKRGIEADLKFAGNDDQVFATVISGEAQFGMSDPVFTAISHDKGGPGKIVALMTTRLGLSGVTNKPSIQQIKSVKQLEGLRLSSFPEPSTTYTLLSELRQKNNLNMPIVQAPFGGQMALLETDKVDIAVDLEPSVSIFEDKGYRVVFNLAKWTDPQAITGLMTTEDYIKKHPETVQKVVDSLQEAFNLLYTNPEVSYRVGKKIYPNLSEKVVRTAVDRMLKGDMYPHSVVVPEDMWQRTLKTRLDSGELKKPQATSVAVDNTFALNAKKKLGATK
ncbi:MAG: ABC transporter substrate-binding protein [Alphaproteobacteria bacterium]|nr:ABC transporter substrate-binding protein [Alphaproteobacteria bacterium]